MGEKRYAVKEIFYTLQGEGFHAGRAAVFCRFTGCNLWSGIEKDRATAICKFCDTDFADMSGENGGKYNVFELTAKIKSLWPSNTDQPCFVVLTGGEPMLQVDELLVNTLHQADIYIAIESNGTLPIASGIDWICISPKAATSLAQIQGNELKLVFPQKENQPEEFENLHFEHLFLQPLDDKNQEDHIAACIQYVRQNPKWKLSLQTHKILNIP